MIDESNKGKERQREESSLSNEGVFKRTRSSAGFIKKYPVLVTALVAIITILAVYYWKDIKAKKEIAIVEASASEQIIQSKQQMLKLLCKPLVWSIRSEMLRGNMEQVDLFTSDIVREKNFQFIHLIDPEGKILLSTDKKMEGQSATGIIANNLLITDSVIIVNGDNENLTVAAPVMGYDKRLATVVFNYFSPGFVKEQDKKTLNSAQKKD